ncbi:RNA methyltransferase [Niabella insulamsoli]|uniref:TrmH family RNA methyltransferase n=1 Tax=Niabella insulamsoli TaxID=3144874 RepID=UPI0031FCD425
MTNERRARLLSVIAKRQFDLAIVLENVFDPHNVSAVMRSCDAVGVQDIYILNTKIPRHRKWGFRSGASAAKWLSIHQFDNVEACFAALRTRYKKIFTTHLNQEAVELHEIDFTERVAMVFGNEHAGVSDEARALADGNFHIPQVGIIKSLNISVACAVTLYEAYRQKSIAGHYLPTEADSPLQRALKNQWGVDTNGI